jgi:flagellar biosynthesis protein FlhG
MDASSQHNGEASRLKPMRVIAVTSGKGGVGKSNIVLNLGISYAQAGRKVLIIDGDLGLGNQDVLLDETPQYTLQHVLAGEQPIENVLLRSKFGVTVLPATSGVAEMASLSEEDRMHLLHAVEGIGDLFDTVLVDTAAGIGSNALFFASAAQELAVVVTPEPTSLADAYAMIKLLALRCGIKRLGVIVNQAASQTEASEIFRRLSTITSRFLPIMIELVGVVPLDSKLREAVRLQRPVVTLYPQAKSSRAIQELSTRLLMRPTSNQGTTGRVQLFWQRLLQSSYETENPDVQVGAP